MSDGTAGVVQAVSDAEFDAQVVSADGPVLVDFWAPWCGPCKAMGPVLEEYATEMSGRVQVVSVNVDDNPDAAARFGVRGIPTLMLFRDGEQVMSLTGAKPKSAIAAQVASHL